MKQDEFEKIIKNGIKYNTELYEKAKAEIDGLDKANIVHQQIAFGLVGFMNKALSSILLLKQVYEPLTNKVLEFSDEISNGLKTLEEPLLNDKGEIIFTVRGKTVTVEEMKKMLEMMNPNKTTKEGGDKQGQ